MSIEDIIINGYVVNVLLICLNILIAFISVIVSVLFQDGFSKDLEIKKLQDKIKAKKQKMSFIKRHNGLLSLLFPYAHILPSFKFWDTVIKAKFNLHKMYQIKANE